VTARLNDRDLNRLLADWLDEGPNTAADFVVARAMARVPTVRRRSAAWWLQRLLRTQGPLLASLAVLLVLGAAAILAIGFILQPTPPPAPSAPAIPSTSPTTTIEPSPSASEEARATSELAVDEINGPVPLSTLGTWKIERGGGSSLNQLTGYQFVWDNRRRWLAIYLNPEGKYDPVSVTRTSDLQVLIGWNFMMTGGGEDDPYAGTGSFLSEQGECTITFSTFTETEVAGTIDCREIPGTYSIRDSGISESSVSVRASFSFDPQRDTNSTPDQ
jgi:hypothetical protein